MKLFKRLGARPFFIVLSLSLALLLFSSHSQAASSLPGWPVQTGTLAYSPITLADVDGDGTSEMVTIANGIQVLKGDGTPVPGWPVHLPVADADGGAPTVAVGDLDGNGKAVVVTTGTQGVYAWNADGTPKAGFPIIVPRDPQTGEYPDFNSNTLADLDGDGTLEIIAVSNFTGKVYAWRHDGTPVPGWPVSMPPSQWSWAQMTPAVGDLDGDGKLELIVPGVESNVYAWHYDGTPVAGWPQSVGYPMYVATGDFAHDGTAKVIVSTAYSTLVAFNGDGSPIPGWPKPGDMVAIGDIDGDGELDIVTDDYEGHVVAYRIDGSLLPGWPQTHGDSLDQPPVLGDVDGDGQVDVLYRTSQSIFGWRADGTVLPGFPLTISTSANLLDGSLALGDINGDGIVDVVTGSGATDTNIYAFALSGQYRRQYLPWPMCSHDPQQTAQLVPSPVIALSSFSAVRGVPFSKNVGVRGGYGPYVWSGGNLPDGLSLNSATGEISGTPLQAGTFQGSVQVADPYTTGASKTVTFTIDVVAIATESLPAGVVQGGYLQTVAVAGGSAPFAWSVAAGSLPPGLTLDAATGTISGRPTASGTFSFTVRVSDAQGWKADKDLKIQVVAWTDTTIDLAWAKSIVVDDAGNYYVAGVQNTPQFQLFAAKYAPTGELLWQRFASGDEMTSIAVDTAGNVYAAGYSFYTAKSFVIKYDSNGTVLWTSEYDGTADPMAMALAVDASQNVYVSGRPGRYEPNSCFLIKYDAAGELKWAKTTINGGPSGIAVGQDGNVYALFGSVVHNYDPSGNELWSRSYGDASAGIVLDRDGNVFIAGSSLTKHDAAGNLVWNVQPEGISISGVTVDSAGNSYLTGSSNSDPLDMVTVKYDAAGNMVWRKIYDGGGNENGEAVAVEKNGSNVFVAVTEHKDGNFNLRIVRYLQPAILTASVANGRVSAPYTQSLAAGAGTGPYTWSVAPGWLPSGLLLDAATGVISGIPWVSGSYTIYVRVTDANGIGDLRIYPIDIDSAVAPSLADFTANRVLGQVPVEVTFSDASSNSPTTWSWLLGDGTSGSGRTLTHLYTTPGTYTVSLTTMSENGTQVVTKDAFVTVLACSNGTARLAMANAPFASLNTAYLAAQDGDWMMLLAVDSREVLELNRDIKLSLTGGFDCSYNNSPLPTTLAGLRITAGTVKPDNLHLR